MSIDGAVALWLCLAVILFAIEACTVNLVTIWFALGCIAACVTAGFALNLYGQMTAFIFTSVALVIFTKPLAEKIRNKKMQATNTDRIIGMEGVALFDVVPQDATGQVKVMGQTWSAISADGVTIAQGDRVLVEEIVGVKVVVKRISDS